MMVVNRMRRTAIAIAAASAAIGSVSAAAQVTCTPGEIPDPRCTPGVAASTDENDVCGIVDGKSYSKRHRQTPAGLKALITKRYGQQPNSGDVEIDHRIPLSLGGEDAVYNLWYEFGRDRGVRFTYHEKDRLERWAWEQVCQRHAMSLRDAQAIFLAPDWRSAYCRYIGGPPC